VIFLDQWGLKECQDDRVKKVYLDLKVEEPTYIR